MRPGPDWEPVTVAASGARVYRVRDTYVKLAALDRQGSCGPADDPRDEAQRIAWLAAHGLPTAEVLEAGADAAEAWLVTRAVPGRSAADLWPDAARPGVVDALADVARALHALPVADCPFDRSLQVTVPQARQRLAEGQVDFADLDAERTGWTGARLLAALDATRPAAEDLVVCHGDPCLPNVLLDPDSLAVTGMIDLGRLGRADRYADLALTTRSLAGGLNPQYGPRFADRYLARYGAVPPDTARLDFYRLLDEFY